MSHPHTPTKQGTCRHTKNLHYTEQQPTPTHPPPTKRGANPFAQAVIQMLATTIHKSNTTPHHQSRAATRTPNTQQRKKHSHHRTIRSRHPPPLRDEPAGLLPQDPTVCLAVLSHQPDPARPTHVRRAPEPHPLQAQPLITNRSNHRTPTPCGRRPSSWCSLERR